MKVLILGGTGFVGVHMVRAFCAAGHEVAVAVRATSDRSVLAGLECEFVLADLTNGPSLEAAARGREVVVHSAGLLSLWEKDGQAIYDANVLGTRRVVEACLAVGVRRLVYTGSMGIYGGTTTPYPVDERGSDEIERFHSFHITSMILAEREVLLAQTRGLETVRLHPSLCLGEGDRNFHSSWALAGLALVRVPFVPPGGLNLVDVCDVAKAHLAAAERAPSGGNYLLGGENLTNQAYAELILKVLGYPSRRVAVSRQGLRSLGKVAEGLARWRGVDRGAYVTLNAAMSEAMSMYWFLDDTRARRELGHSPSSVEAALVRQVAWLEANDLLPRGGLSGVKSFYDRFLGGSLS